jgi:ATP-dependent helicase HrpB
MAGLPLHPRLAHMMLEARRLRRTRLACDLAALLGERDPLRGHGPVDPDLRLRLALLSAARRGHRGGAGVDRGALRRVLAAAEHWRRRLARGTAADDGHGDEDADAGLLLAHAYPDRVAQRRPNARGAFLLRSGRGVALDPASALAAEEFIVAAEVDERVGAGRVFLAAPVARSDVEREFADRVVSEERIEWDPARRATRALRTVRLGALVLEQSPLPDPDPAALAAALAAGIRAQGLAALPWTAASRGLRDRLAFAHSLDGDAWPDVSDAALTEGLERWLGGALHALRATVELSGDALHRALETLIPAGRRRALDALAPTHILVPSGSRVAIDYSRADAPVVSVRLQEVFGLLESPRIAHGRVPLTFRLLSPANRPVQVTRDLASFWRTGYFDVRKDLRGRYPKHDWPEDPHAAVASRGPKRKR